jgi:hypothetical protein
MKHEMIDYISIDQIYVDLNESIKFKEHKLPALIKESKTVLYGPNYQF